MFVIFAIVIPNVGKLNIYLASKAQEKYENLLISSRQGINITEDVQKNSMN